MSFQTKGMPVDNWRTPGTTERYTLEAVFKKIKTFATDFEYLAYEHDVGIGTDSQMVGTKFQFISVISAHRKGKGGLYFFHRSFEMRTKFPVENQKMRMFSEATRSIELAYFMQEQTKIEPIIHVDASPPNNSKEFTAKFSEQLRGYVQGCGFICMLKPESYVAHSIADKHTKKRTRKVRKKKQLEE